MAEKQHLQLSQGSASDTSQTFFTPSDTQPSPSGTMVDVSQPGMSMEYRGLNDHIEGIVPGTQWPMDIDFDLTPNIVPVFDYSSTWEDRQPVAEQDQDHSGATVNGRADLFDRQPYDTLNSSDVATPLVAAPIDHEGFNKEHPWHSSNERVHGRLAAFDQAYRYIPGSGLPLSTGSIGNDGPRYIPDVSEWENGPWSSLLVDEQVDRTPLVPDLIYEPAMDQGLQGVDVQTSGHQEALAQALEYDTPLEAVPSLRDPALPEDNIDPPPPPDPLGPPPDVASGIKHRSLKATRAKVIGGRRHGPLKEKSRQSAETTRQKGQCWGCALQRNQCEFVNEKDKTCKGCKNKRGQSLLQGCIRMKLPILTSIFIPANLAEQHKPEKLRDFVLERVHRWSDNHLPVYLTWGYFRPLKFDVTEVEPKGSSLLFQNQYRLDLSTNQYNLVQVPSPPLGMTLMFPTRWRSKFSIYLETLLRTCFRQFPEVCFRGDNCRVEKDFLLPIFEYHEATTGKAKKLVHSSLKLVVVTHLMTHSMTLVESTKDDVYDRLKNPPPERYGHHTCPRLLNKQVKFLLCLLHQEVLEDVLGQIQEALRLSRKSGTWAALFSGMVILAMTVGSLQVAVRGKEETDKSEGTIQQDDTTADEAVKSMEGQFEFLKNLFHQGYRTLVPKGLNPLQNLQDRACLDGASQSLAAKASKIMEDHYDFLVERHGLPPPSNASEPQTARLIARFLLCFAPPGKQHHHQPADPASSEQRTNDSM